MTEIEESNLSLEKIISEVDYVKLGEDYIPSTFAIKFINFIKLVNGEAGEENKSPLFHYEILDTIDAIIEIMNIKKCFLAVTTEDGTLIDMLLNNIGTYPKIDLKLFNSNFYIGNKNIKLNRIE